MSTFSSDDRCENGRHYPLWRNRLCRQEALEAFATELVSQEPGRSLGVGKPTVMVADTDDPASLFKMAQGSSVVASTVGPYATFGTPLVEACASSGTDYCDLTGEVQWIRRVIDRFHKSAQESGARIVHSCGFDSVPSDLGVLLAQQRHREETGKPAGVLRMRVLRQAGGVSRGTLDSMVELVKEATRDREVRAVLRDPHSLEPGWTPPGRKGRAVPFRDPVSGEWTLPFLMEAVNGRVVRRYEYGSNRNRRLFHGEAPLGASSTAHLCRFALAMGFGTESFG